MYKIHCRVLCKFFSSAMGPKRGKFSLPDRWTEYTALGSIIEKTRIIAFKTPLNERICSLHLDSPEAWFTPAILLQKLPNLKLIIDLTQTDRFYQEEEITRNGVSYRKIYCPGGGQVIPFVHIVEKFIREIDNFMDSQAVVDKDALIGVHCTHGLNRTGYLICQYLIKRCGLQPEKAIEAFEKARGYKMERPLYVNDIKKTQKLHSSAPKSREISERNSHSNERRRYPQHHSVPHQFPTSNEPSSSRFFEDRPIVTRPSQYNYERRSHTHPYEQFSPKIRAPSPSCLPYPRDLLQNSYQLPMRQQHSNLGQPNQPHQRNLNDTNPESPFNKKHWNTKRRNRNNT